MRQWMYNARMNGWESLALLLLRLVMGTAFIFHGWPKMQQPASWMNADAGVPGILQALAAGIEFGGGAALILGFLTRVASLGLIGVMAAAFVLVHWPLGHPFVGKSGTPSFELAAIYLVCAAALFLLGPGRFSIDAMIFSPLGRPHPPRP